MTFDPSCPVCDSDLEWSDTFGNLDHCLESIGYHPHNVNYERRNPVKAGDIWHCEKCDEIFYTFDHGDGQVHEGYPC